MLDKTRAKIGLISRLFNKLELAIKKQINRVRSLKLIIDYNLQSKNRLLSQYWVLMLGFNLRLKQAEGGLNNV